jgi:enolase-phosphatase E1
MTFHLHRLPRPSVILLDIEGTISSLPHVVETHYPYTRRHIAAYLDAHRGEPVVEAALAETRALAGPGVEPLQALLKWIDEDAKAPPLKLLQGLVWTRGYQTGELVGHIYPDALAALSDWHARGFPLHIFSSGSVQCQVQFFESCPEGDLSHLFSRHFDTGVGAKVQTSSYVRVAAALDLVPAEILFFSDNPRELDAATSAGLRVVQVLREGAIGAGSFPSITSFAQVELETAP